MRLLQFAFDGHSDMFSISKTGTLDYVATAESTDILPLKRLVGETCGQTPLKSDVPVIRQDWDGHTFEAYGKACTITLFSPSDCFASLDAGLYGFCQRYPDFSLAMERGDFLCATRILLRSTKLRPFHRLLGYIYQDLSVWPLLLHHLYDFSENADDNLRHAIRRMGDTTEEYSLLTTFAEGSGGLPFSDGAGLLEYFTANPRRLQIPVVGGRYHQGEMNTVLGQVQAVYDFLVEDRLRGNVTSDGFQSAFLQKVESMFSVSLVHDRCNAYDPHAVAVVIRGIDGIERHVGYLRRTIAGTMDDLAGYAVSIAAVGPRVIELALTPPVTMKTISC